jgi:hypothetical protein
MATTAHNSATMAPPTHRDLDVGVSINSSISVSVSELVEDNDTLIEEEKEYKEAVELKIKEDGLPPDSEVGLAGVVVTKVYTAEGQIIRRRTKARNNEPVPELATIVINGKLSSTPLPEYFWIYIFAFASAFLVALLTLMGGATIIGVSWTLMIFMFVNGVAGALFIAAFYFINPGQKKIA